MAKATSRKSSESIPRSSMTWLSGEMFSRGMSQISEMMSATVSKVDAMTSSSFGRAQATYRLVGSLSTLGRPRCSRREDTRRHGSSSGISSNPNAAWTSSVERVRVGAHDELFVVGQRLAVLALDPPQQIGRFRLVRIPVSEQLDQPPPLPLRLLA